MTEAIRTVKTQELINGMKHIKPKCGIVDENEACLIARDILGGHFRCPTSNNNVFQLQCFSDSILTASRTMVFKNFFNFLIRPSQ